MAIGSRVPQSSYYDKYNRPTAALQRARRPYLVKNAFTGLGVLGFAVGVYVFTIKAVAQDDFEDVPIPDGPAPAAGAPHTSVNSSAGKAAQ
ncbi:coiled-coil domain-containing protein 2 [Elsinoe australis]|uniref:Cytochrome c oxidase assembly factor 3 n=1 Tax=Elsinoe australis TaxID=40998 RepID=A0A2P8A5K0_9PEZI|nr:hypothetical protein B9Z65_4614 [Elsinoe australis]TKX25581.1 coiled-coil domain-containing protein 2 [Elsinoe australis]